MYTDIEAGKVLKRSAVYNISGECLTLKELDRSYNRQAKIINLDEEPLILTPKVEGRDGKGKMVFSRISRD
ncbi:hypothetical protein FKX85_16880 [Echinicola soli]|uniref:Lipocalin-like domain-containing protein n=1 Tax=Echinicola soli TaxID=2591634 RepID=A0A514CLQ9_9BACT|nr:hypothetical protein [Echinicola soli]QDH80624.1 hypothetical protein FKX85_16880 [Echinicola soli]